MKIPEIRMPGTSGTPEPSTTGEPEVLPIKKRHPVTQRTLKSQVPIYLKAAEGFDDVEIEVLPVDTLGQARHAAGVFNDVAEAREKEGLPRPGSMFDRPTTEEMALRMFWERETFSPVVITNTSDSGQDLSVFWDRVRELQADSTQVV